MLCVILHKISKTTQNKQKKYEKDDRHNKQRQAVSVAFDHTGWHIPGNQGTDHAGLRNNALRPLLLVVRTHENSLSRHAENRGNRRQKNIRILTKLLTHKLLNV